MNITSALIDFLLISKNLSHSTIVICDLKTIQYVVPKQSTWLSKSISSSLKEILQFYQNNPNDIDFINTDMTRILPIFDGANMSYYCSEMILPLQDQNHLQGLLIFLRTHPPFIASNLNFAKTTKFFVEMLLQNHI